MSLFVIRSHLSVPPPPIHTFPPLPILFLIFYPPFLQYFLLLFLFRFFSLMSLISFRSIPPYNSLFNLTVLFIFISLQGFVIICRQVLYYTQSFCPFVRISVPRPLSRKRVCPLWNQRRGQHSLAGEGCGGTQFGRLKRKPGTLQYTLCYFLSCNSFPHFLLCTYSAPFLSLHPFLLLRVRCMLPYTFLILCTFSIF